MVFYGAMSSSFHLMVFIMWVLSCGFLVGWGLRYRFYWFGGLGLKSWICFFGEAGFEA